MAKTFQIISIFIVFLAILMTSSVNATVVMRKLRNDKEAGSKQYRVSELVKLYHKNPGGKVVGIVNDFTKDLEKVLKYAQEKDLVCELYVSRSLMKLNKIPVDEPGLLRDKLILARNFDKIDDVLFQILNRAAELSEELADLPKKAPRFFTHSRFRNSYLLNDFEIKKGSRKDLVEALKTIKKLPSEKNGCVSDMLEIFGFQVQKFLKHDEVSYADQMKFLRTALEKKWISDFYFNYTEKLLKEGVHEWKSNLARYLEINQNAKNVFTDYLQARAESGKNLNAVQIKRYNLLTRRLELYDKYDRHQVVMLAEILKKASTRMGTDEFVEDSIASVRHEYSDWRTGEKFVENYVLSPMEQFNWARRMMRKDMYELQKSTHFKYVAITYDDVIAASLETGLVGKAEVEYILTYDDLWNKEVTFMDKVKGFLFGLGGTATLFLPPPYNVITSLGIVFINSRLGEEKDDFNDQSHIFKVVN